MNVGALVIFNQRLTTNEVEWLKNHASFDEIVAPKELHTQLTFLNVRLRSLEEFLCSGSICEASALLNELSLVVTKDGRRITKTIVYDGYELWWFHATDLFLSFCLPFTQMRQLLEHLAGFKKVFVWGATHQGLFTCYLKTRGCVIEHIEYPKLKSPKALPFGVAVQIALTIPFFLMCLFQRKKILVFTGDKFDGAHDYDFRMKFIYDELRTRELSFVEFVRSLEPWRIVLSHAVKRRRPVIYSVAVAFVARYISIVVGGRRRSKRHLEIQSPSTEASFDERLKYAFATQYLYTASDDIWGIRLMRLILKNIGVRTAFITAINERNFHTAIGCKQLGIPTTGILHGAASVHYNVYDFLPTYDGVKNISVDTYGVWSEWWKRYYEKHSRVYRHGQIVVSGLMRPIVSKGSATKQQQNTTIKKRPKILFVSEQLAVPNEVLPYLEALLQSDVFDVYFTFRPYRDNFELWLQKNRKDILAEIGEERILRNGIKEAIQVCDIVIGTHSTAVLESLFELKPFVFFTTKKWGDYFGIKEHGDGQQFYAGSPDDLLMKVQKNLHISTDVLNGLRERFFGDPYQNGSKWVVDEIVSTLHKRK